MRKTLFCLLLLLLTISVNGRDLKFKIIPQPQKMEITSTKGLEWNELKFIKAKGNATIPVVGDILDQLPRSERKGVGVVLVLRDHLPFDSNEGYLLEVSSNGVHIEAKTQAGLFYGCQTLEQLLVDSRDQEMVIPSLKITDYPLIAYRSIHLDTKNHLDRVEYYYRMIDKLSEYKINGIIWELEDKLKFTRRPEVAAPNAITKDEMKAISRYAKERHIEISPLVQGLGHAGFILKHHWELRESLHSDWEFCPSDPRTYEVLYDLYRDALEALPDGKYLHIGGDEVGDIGIDDRCKATGKTAFELQMYWLKQVCDFATAHGRIPIFWDDMPLKHGGLWPLVVEDAEGEELDRQWSTEKLDKAIQLFPTDCIYMRWNYGDPTLPAHKRIMEWYSKQNLHVMAATAASDGGCPFLPRNNSKAQEIKDFSTLVFENKLEGILATAWDDGSPHLETVWRGFIAQGEYGWNPQGRSVEEYKAAHGQREFGFLPQDNRMHFLDLLEKTIEFFDGALAVSGRRNPAWGTTNFELMSLPNIGNKGEWSKKYADKIERAKEEDEVYYQIKEGIEIAKKEALRNRYTLDIYEQINEMQHFPTQLILALHQYDVAQGEKTASALDEVKKLRDDFFVMRINLEQVFSKTRMLENGEGYVLANNHHNHLAAKTPNNDWLFYYELPMIKKLDIWFSSREK